MHRDPSNGHNDSATGKDDAVHPARYGSGRVPQHRSPHPAESRNPLSRRDIPTSVHSFLGTHPTYRLFTFHRRHSNSICFSLITILSANCYITVYIMKVAIGWFVATYSV